MDMGQQAGDHAGHDHSAHDKYHDVVSRLPDGRYVYTHGAFLGHLVPGSFFIIWASWWLIATFHHYLRCASTRTSFRCRPWYEVFFGPDWFTKIPLEPLIKITLPFFGILGELWLGHESWRTLHAPNGKFNVDNINDWQHSTMYACFIVSGIVDLCVKYLDGPPGSDRAFLGLAFLAQFLLLVFHLKGPPIEIMVHLILALQVASIVVAIAVEGAASGHIVVATARPALTLLQGVWWIQTAYIMYVSDPAFDPDEMGGTMMTPVLLVAHMLWISFGSLLLLLVMRFIQSKVTGQEIKLGGTVASSSTGAGTPLHGKGVLYDTVNDHDQDEMVMVMGGVGNHNQHHHNNGSVRAVELAGLGNASLSSPPPPPPVVAQTHAQVAPHRLHTHTR